MEEYPDFALLASNDDEGPNKNDGEVQDYDLQEVVEYALEAAYENEEECVNDAYAGLEDCYFNSGGEDEFDEESAIACIDGLPDPCDPFIKIIKDEFPGIDIDFSNSGDKSDDNSGGEEFV